MRSLLIGIVFSITAWAQSPETFKTRLSVVALDAAMKSTVAGVGMSSATLTGAKFVVTGTFEGLKSNATVAHIHQGSMTGVRGPKVLDLTIDKSTKGSLSGSFDLTPDQIKMLKAGRWYVQIHSEKAPEGNLWGWLLK